jgi:hypothetical protein
MDIQTQTSIGVSCTEPGCDCFVDGVSKICPGMDEENFDNGIVTSSHVYVLAGTSRFLRRLGPSRRRASAFG